MIATLTNTSGRVLNALDTLVVGPFGPAQINAVGGAVKDPLPHPFNRNGSVAIAGTKVLPVHPQDFRFQPVMGSNPEPRDALNLLVQAGLITLGFAAQTPIRDPEEEFANAV